ncbi:hypothetical protein CHCC14814_2916 [Bacillus paralicheniformis]|nr:hypothetical protein CHCC14814_2916 [Bacillus paralicheniformis]
MIPPTIAYDEGLFKYSPGLHLKNAFSIRFQPAKKLPPK